MSKKTTKQSPMDRQGAKALSRQQMMRQIRMLYDMLMETRNVLMQMTQKNEQDKVRYISEWDTIKQLFVEHCGVLEEDIDKMLGDNYTSNVDKYNKYLQERMEEFEKLAQEQADQVTEKAQEYLEEEGLLEEVEDEDEILERKAEEAHEEHVKENE